MPSFMCILLCQFIQRNCNSKLEVAQREPVGSHNNGEVIAFEPVSCFTSLLVSILKLGNTFQFHLRLFLYPSFLHSRNICIGPDKSHNLPTEDFIQSSEEKLSLLFICFFVSSSSFLVTLCLSINSFSYNPPILLKAQFR